MWVDVGQPFVCDVDNVTNEELTALLFNIITTATYFGFILQDMFRLYIQTVAMTQIIHAVLYISLYIIYKYMSSRNMLL